MACFSKMWLLQNFHKVKVLALTIFLYLISPLILFPALLLYVYRGLVCVSAKIYRKDLTKIIGPSTSVYASDELYGIPNRNIVCSLTVKGTLSLESLQNTIHRKIVSLKNAKGNYKYPELRMYPAKFGRYLFWKEEENFKLENHVVMYDKARDNNRIWTEQDLQEIQKNFIRKQWSRFAAPWEILLLPNYRTQSCGAREVKTVLVFRYHMCIGNEVPWMKLLVKVLCDFDGAGDGVGTRNCVPDVCSSPKSPIKFIIPSSQVSPSESRAPSTIVNVFEKHLSKAIQNTRTNLVSPSHPSQAAFQRTSQKFALIFRKMLNKLVIPFRIPFDFAEQIMEPLSSNSGPSNEWEVEETSLLKRDHVVVLDRFSVQHVKEIKNMLGVTFSSVLMAALSSALRVTFMEAGLKLPTHMKLMLPLTPNSESDADLMASGNGENDKSNGNGSICWVNLPMGVSSSRERLRCCESAQKKLHKSTRLISNKVMLSLIGLLPFKYHWYFLRRRPWTGVMINLKGPKETLTLCDHQVEDVILSSASDSGFVLSFVSYADYLRISLVIDYRLVPNEVMAKNLLKNIYAELVLLGIDGTATV